MSDRMKSGGTMDGKRGTVPFLVVIWRGPVGEMSQVAAVFLLICMLDPVAKLVCGNLGP